MAIPPPVTPATPGSVFDLPTPLPPTPPVSTQPRSAKKVGKPIFVYTPAWVEQELAKEDGLARVAERMQMLSKRARSYQRQATQTQAEVFGAGTRLPRQEPSTSPANVQRRATRCALKMAAILFGRPNRIKLQR
jgi:hypothetical protein